mmetsp:Transcript_10632/g.65552  ORF Transcript_10632/g.65552 Transcript_10632/m.65552 type:complete len:268 (-) Transcript_10632:64-867(-)
MLCPGGLALHFFSFLRGFSHHLLQPLVVTFSLPRFFQGIMQRFTAQRIVLGVFLLLHALRSRKEIVRQLTQLTGHSQNFRVSHICRWERSHRLPSALFVLRLALVATDALASVLPGLILGAADGTVQHALQRGSGHHVSEHACFAPGAFLPGRIACQPALSVRRLLRRGRGPRCLDRPVAVVFASVSFSTFLLFHRRVVSQLRHHHRLSQLFFQRWWCPSALPPTTTCTGLRTGLAWIRLAGGAGHVAQVRHGAPRGLVRHLSRFRA